MRKRRNSLESLHNTLRLALEGGRMYAFDWDFKSDVVQRSAECINVLGVPDCRLEESGMEFLARIHPTDRARYLGALSELSPVHKTYVTLYRQQLRRGKACWIEARGRGFFDYKGNLVRVVGIASDVTARKESEEALRKVSARLINAQEEQRKRFARELHDGVSQTLALISTEVAQAAQAANCKDSDLASTLNRVYGRLQDIASDISRLSHELHPTTLKHLGLTAAIQSLCREVSASMGIDVEFTERGDPQPTSKETALCLYRIVQEALHNVVKHSGSKKVRVELNSSADEIRLSITDDGIGFDTRSQKGGLGLVSMRERLRLVEGKIVISSRRNSGTRVVASVPLMSSAIKPAA